jgi:hypothetical protein
VHTDNRDGSVSGQPEEDTVALRQSEEDYVAVRQPEEEFRLLLFWTDAF